MFFFARKCCALFWAYLSQMLHVPNIYVHIYHEFESNVGEYCIYRASGYGLKTLAFCKSQTRGAFRRRFSGSVILVLGSGASCTGSTFTGTRWAPRIVINGVMWPL